jgi:hypothetical protein
LRLFDILKKEEIHKGEGSLNNWLIEDKSDVKKLIEVIPHYLKETILPYFEQNSSIESVDKLLNKYPREISIHNSLYPLRANLAIIAARLNNNPKYNDLLNIYQEELEEADITYKEDFEKLIFLNRF